MFEDSRLEGCRRMQVQDIVRDARAQTGDRSVERTDKPAAPALAVDRMELFVVSGMATLEPVWRQLQALPRNSLHQGYDWCKAWVDTHKPDLAVVEGRIDGRTVMILPLEIEHRAGIRTAYPPARGHNNLNSGLFSHDFALTAEEQALFCQKLAACLKHRVDLVVMDTVPLVWRGLRHPFAGLTAVAHQNHSFQLPILDTFEKTIGQLNAKRRRKKFRVQVRRMEEAGGYEHYIPQTREERHALLEIFFAQKRARFKAHGLPDAFGRKEVRDFFHSLLDVPPHGHDQPLFLHAIRLSGEPGKPVVGISGMSRKGDHLICQFGSIDSVRVPEASPGELLYWLMIEKAGVEGIKLFDFGVGDQGYKRSWCPTETSLFDILIPLTPKGRIATHVYAGLVRLKTRLKHQPKLYRLVQRLRAGRKRPSTEE
jgi:CelD/BcsL family acetyltransferase involved in cellulose biosynthesis